MATLKEIKKELEIIRTIKNIASIYYEIANLKMKEIRESALKNREFFEELVKTYHRIESASLMGMEKKVREIRLKREKKPEVLVFLSANEPLYGPLISEIWKEVEKYLKRKESELVVVGKIGKYLAERHGYEIKIYYFDLDDERPTIEQIGKIVEFIKNYQNVLVFFGRYYGGLIQRPAIEKISGKIEMKEKIRKTKSYLFEPSPQEILEFFEDEILGVLFNITILEHQLARLAARTLAMSEATERAKKVEREIIKKEIKLKREMVAKKQIEIFNQLISWEREKS